MELSELYSPIKAELKKLETKLESTAENGDPFVSEVARYIFGTKGKRLRPALAILSSKINGNGSDKAVDLATSIELIHTATLIQDDVVDGSKLRRGKPSVAAKWGSGAAILFGDYLYSKAFDLIVKLKIPEITHLMLEATARICEGELRQLKLSKKKKLGEKEYLELIARKTATLFSVSCETGAILGGLRDSEINALKDYGRYFGMVFQITDDCLDGQGGGNLKSIAQDFAEKARGCVLLLNGSKLKPVFNNLVDFALNRTS